MMLVLTRMIIIKIANIFEHAGIISFRVQPYVIHHIIKSLGRGGLEKSTGFRQSQETL